MNAGDNFTQALLAILQLHVFDHPNSKAILRTTNDRQRWIQLWNACIPSSWRLRMHIEKADSS